MTLMIILIIDPEEHQLSQASIVYVLSLHTNEIDYNCQIYRDTIIISVHYICINNMSPQLDRFHS